MVGGGLHRNRGPAQDPCKELATGLSKGVLETQPKQEQEAQHPGLLGPASALPWFLRRLATNCTPCTASVFSCETGRSHIHRDSPVTFLSLSFFILQLGFQSLTQGLFENSAGFRVCQT